MAATEIIPVIDLGPYLAGAPGAIDRTAGELQFALTEIGFYFIVNHGVPSGQIREVFRQVARFHAQPLEKEAGDQARQTQCRLPADDGDTLRTSTVETVTKPNLNEALFVARDLPSDHPDCWPVGASAAPTVGRPGCRLSRRHRGLLRHDGAAAAEDGPSLRRCAGPTAEYFDQPFKEPQYKLRMTHYPHQAGTPDDEFGIAPQHGYQFPHVACPERRTRSLNPYTKRQMDRRTGHS